MACTRKNQDDSIIKVRLKDGWKALTLSGCEQIVAEPGQLFLHFEKTFKSDGHNCVGVKRLVCNGEQMSVVVKRHSYGKGLREFFRSLSVSKASRNFRLALKLQKKNIAVARPLAALQRKKFGRLQECIFVTEYNSNRISLNDFVHGRMALPENELSEAKQQITDEVAQLLAALHKASMWHRDSKVANFLIYKDDENSFKAELVDMDGIKRYRFKRADSQLRTLWKLAESLSRFSMVEKNDYLRGFSIYCDIAGIDKEERKEIFAGCGRMALTRRLLTLAEDAYKSE